METTMCVDANNKTTAVNKESTYTFSIHTSQEESNSNTQLQLSDGFSPAVRIKFLYKLKKT